MNPPDLENKSKDNSIETFYSKGVERDMQWE